MHLAAYMISFGALGDVTAVLGRRQSVDEILTNIISPFLSFITYCLTLNNFVCVISRSVPYRVRVRLARKRNEDEDSPHKLYTLVSFVEVVTFKGKNNINICVCTLSVFNSVFRIPNNNKKKKETDSVIGGR